MNMRFGVKKIHWFLLFEMMLLLVWVAWIAEYDIVSIYKQFWAMPATMVFGSFIAGASSQGGGAFAFPVLTLVLDVSPADARIFSFGIQSFGMTAAAVLIFAKQIKILKNIVLIVSIAGIIGVAVGHWLFVPILPATETKLFFVSLWASFGFVLWKVNKSKNRFLVADLPPMAFKSKALLIVFGIIGGIVSAILGNGIDIIVFTFLTLYFGIDEKIATPTSVVLMSINTVAGFLFHGLWLGDINPTTTKYILAAVPVALIMAPLGSYVISKWNRMSINKLLYMIIVAQFAGAVVVTKPSIGQWLLIGVVMLAGILVFFFLYHFGKWHARELNKLHLKGDGIETG